MYFTTPTSNFPCENLVSCSLAQRGTVSQEGALRRDFKLENLEVEMTFLLVHNVDCRSRARNLYNFGVLLYRATDASCNRQGILTFNRNMRIEFLASETLAHAAVAPSVDSSVPVQFGTIL